MKKVNCRIGVLFILIAFFASCASKNKRLIASSGESSNVSNNELKKRLRRYLGGSQHNNIHTEFTMLAYKLNKELDFLEMWTKETSRYQDDFEKRLFEYKIKELSADWKRAQILHTAQVRLLSRIHLDERFKNLLTIETQNEIDTLVESHKNVSLYFSSLDPSDALNESNGGSDSLEIQSLLKKLKIKLKESLFFVGKFSNVVLLNNLSLDKRD